MVSERETGERAEATQPAKADLDGQLKDPRRQESRNDDISPKSKEEF